MKRFKPGPVTAEQAGGRGLIRSGSLHFRFFIQCLVWFSIFAPVNSNLRAQDWNMFAGNLYRNNYHPMTRLNLGFDPAGKTSLTWSSKVGSAGISSVIVGQGRVLVSTNNTAGYRPKHPAKSDRGVLLCFDEKTGKFLWQLTRDKLKTGRVNDWPGQGIISCAAIDQGRAYIVTNRAEVLCLDLDGFRDGKNDGEFQEETDTETMDADIIWSLDMIAELGVFPHNVSICSPLVYKNRVFVITSNGVGAGHVRLPSPQAPSFLCLDKRTGKIIWRDSTPSDQIMHGQWSSPTLGKVNGKMQVYMAGGDGWIYAFDADSDQRKLIWKFDMNPKHLKRVLGGKGGRDNVISIPVFVDNSVIVGVGQDVEHGEGVGRLYRIDATKQGDVSPELGARGAIGRKNPESAVIWMYGGLDTDATVTGKKNGVIFNRTVSSAVVSNGLVYAADVFGVLHCIDFESGKRKWAHDLFSAIWGSPLVADGKVLIGNQDGELFVFKDSKTRTLITRIDFPNPLYSTPALANGGLFLTHNSVVYRFDVSD